MHATLVLIATFLVVAALLLRAQQPKIHRHGKRLRRPPGTLPFFGNGLRFLQPRQKLFHWFTECERQFGFETFEISVPTLPPGVVINDPKNLEYVLKRDDLFTKGEFFRQRSRDLFGDGIINADGAIWRVQRKAALKSFSNPNLKTLVDTVFPQYLEETKSYLLSQTRRNEAVNLQEVFMEFATRVMGRFAYNMDMHSSSSFCRSFDFASGATGLRFQNPLWRITEFFFGATLRRALHEVKDFGRTIVATAARTHARHGLKHKESEEKTIGSRAVPNGENSLDALSGSLITSLLDELNDPEAVSDAALNFLSAGKDTIAQALTWTFYLLMRHPEAMKNMRTELGHVFKGNPNLNLSFDVLQSDSLLYTLAAFNESLRLYPPVPFELKQCVAPTTLPDGTFLPENAVLVWCPWAMGRSRSIWGEDADCFRPERWLIGDITENGTKIPAKDGDTKTRLRSKTAFEFPVFNGGPRSCLGKKMAELQAVYVIAALVWEFDFEECHDDGRGSGNGQPPERVSMNSLTLPMEGGLPSRVRIIDRSQ